MAGEIHEKARFNSNPAQLQQVRELVRQTGQRLELTTTTIEKLVLAVNEACMNIIQHGYDANDGDIALEIISGVEEIIFRITDHAPRIDKAKLVSRRLDDIRPGGLGLHFIKSVMDNIEYKSGDNNIGNILELRKKIRPGEAL